MRVPDCRSQHDALVPSGYVLVYRPGFANFCPGCGRSHWHVGRHTAECAWCTTALPIAAEWREQQGDAVATPLWRSLLSLEGWRGLLPAS